MCVFETVAGASMAAQAAAFSANAALAISAVTAVATPIMQYQQQNATADYQKRIYEYNEQIADNNLMQQYSAISRRQQEESKKFAQEMSIISRRGAEARSTALVSAVEGGVSGLSVDALMGNYYRQQADYLQTTQDQMRANLFQLEQQKEQARYGYQGNVLSMLPSSPGGSLAGMGLGIAGGAAGLYSDLYINQYDRNTTRTVFSA
ncbi:hypothetical protein UFOVP403_27 [uncultured Caudovirales phage]|uniref:Internal virion protein n=1 Tax=uncultured Caudovirales phage TaxID=2100421 RepID=A0A6J5M4V7_9CAUD|nr:hypothetical protein UFOVP403_27 [uncultured Caudovirales phage]